MRGEETEAVVSIYLCYYKCYLVESWGSEGVKEAFAETEQVGGEAIDAVGVNSSQVGEHEGFSYYGCVFWRDAIAFQHVFGEGEGGGLGDVEFWGGVM